MVTGSCLIAFQRGIFYTHLFFIFPSNQRLTRAKKPSRRINLTVWLTPIVLW